MTLVRLAPHAYVHSHDSPPGCRLPNAAARGLRRDSEIGHRLQAVVILPALHDVSSYERSHYRIVPASENTIDVQITFRARDAEGRTVRKTEECNLPKDAAFNEQEARAHLEEQKRAAAEAEARSEVTQETPSLEEQQQKYHDAMEVRTKRLLQADDDEGKAILRELQELMTIKKEGYEGAPVKPAE